MKTLVEAIKDLNILNVGSKSYNATLMYEDGTFLLADDLNINLFDKNRQEDRVGAVVFHFFQEIPLP